MKRLPPPRRNAILAAISDRGFPPGHFGSETQKCQISEPLAEYFNRKQAKIIHFTTIPSLHSHEQLDDLST